ncbi:MAG: GAF domain-containing protein [Chloroflexota bacterium]
MKPDSSNHPRRTGQMDEGLLVWVVALLLGTLSVALYRTLWLPSLMRGMDLALGRHAIDRILFLVPVAVATLSLGRRTGILTLCLAALVMTPQAVWVSDLPVNATTEVLAVCMVGGLLIHLSVTEDREKLLRREAVARMRSFNAMCSIVAKSLELEQVLNETLDKALEVTHLDVGWMCTVDEQAGTLVLRAHRGLERQTIRELKQHPLDCGLWEDAAHSVEPVIVQALPGNPGAKGSPLERECLRSLISVPLRSKGRVQGVMCLGSHTPRRFPPADVQLVTTFGKQIGVGVENAQLHRDLEKRLRVQRRLNEVAARITSELELDKILPNVLQIAEELTEADCGFIALFDSATGRLSYPYLHNLPNRLKDVTVANGEGAAGETMANVRPGVISDYQDYDNAVPAFAEAGLASVAAVPIISGNRTFGTLAVGSLHTTRRFSETEVSTLASVGRQAGIAIDNARLYETMRYYARQSTRAQEDERKRIAREAHDETAQILVALSRRLDALRTSPALPARSVNGQLEDIQGLATEALQSVRRFSRDLRPPVLDDLGLIPAIRGLTRSLQEAGIEAELSVKGPSHRLSPEEELVLFRIAQESLNNVRRHASAQQVEVQVSFARDRVQMAIDDDGQGFEAPDKFVDLVASGKLGLIGMHERARILGGTLCIQSTPGEGTRVIVNTPVHKRAPS